MKIILLLSVAFAFVGASTSFAQRDSTLYVYGIPVTEDDSVEYVEPPDLEPRDNFIAVSKSELPKRLLRTLEKDLYKGWDRRGVFLDKNTGLYIVTVPIENGFKIFGLDKDGKGVTFREEVADQ